jgi:hypothetical protein
MAHTSYRHKEENTKNRRKREARQQELGMDALKKEEDSYNRELYGELIPTLYSWMTPDEQMKRAEEISKDVD